MPAEHKLHPPLVSDLPNDTMQAPPAPDAMTQIAAVLARLADQPSAMTPEQLSAIVNAASANAANQGAESLRSVLHPQNAQHPGKSAFSHPEGDVKHPKAVLRPNKEGQPGAEVFFCGARQDPDQLTPAQIDLFNRFDRTRTSRNGRWKADVANDGLGLSVWVPAKTIDDRMDLPSLDLILIELLDGAASVDPVSLAERVAELEKQLALR